MLNKQGKNKIDWCNYSWNPIAGCLHACNYCYLLRMEKRFKGFMQPKFRPHYLADPLGLKKPSRIFVGSSGDGWGEWVNSFWIEDVLNACVLAHWHIFLFLTKNPKRYIEFEPIMNAWYGTTDDGTERTKNNIRDLVYSVQVPPMGRFVSFEPLLKPVEPNLFGIQWIIIGANSNKGAKKPPDEWADRLIELAREQKVAVWMKDNYKYKKRIKEFPNI